jgi:hypothetical protein
MPCGANVAGPADFKSGVPFCMPAVKSAARLAGRRETPSNTAISGNIRVDMADSLNPWFLMG